MGDFDLTSYEKAIGVTGWQSRYKSVDRVLKHLARKTQSIGSRRSFAEGLVFFQRYTNVSDPDSFLALDKAIIEEKVQEFLDSMRTKGASLRTIKAVRSNLLMFFRENGFKNNRALEIQAHHVPARYRKRAEYIPSMEEALKMADLSGGLKNRAIILCLATSGIRNGTLRALRYKDVKADIDAGTESIFVPVYPEMKTIVPNACKNNIPYYTFFGGVAVEALRAYLKERKEKQGSMDGEEILFATDFDSVPADRRRFTAMSKHGLQSLVKAAAKRANLAWHDVFPHTLRKTFEGVLRNGRMETKSQEFLMGHLLPGAQDAYFGSGVTVSGSTISFERAKVNDIRAIYENLSWSGSRSGEELRKESTRQTLRILEGFGVIPKEEIERLNKLVDEKSVDEIDWGAVIKQLKREGTQPATKQKAVSADDAEKLVEEGWKYIGTLPNGKVVVEGSTPTTATTFEGPQLHPSPPRGNSRF